MLSVALSVSTHGSLISKELERMSVVGNEVTNTAVVLEDYFKYLGGLNKN
jgi:hypothetical protein